MRLSAAVGIALVAVFAAGCGKAGKTITPGGGGDVGGAHLVVFASDRGQAVGQFDLYLYDLDALGFRLIKNISSATAADRHPTISSDGTVIAFDSNRGGAGGSDILLYSRFDQALVSLPGVNTSADETEPLFTGDALKLAFVRAAGPYRRIRLVDGLADTLLSLPGLDTLAAFSDFSPSPDQTGNRIAFASDRSGHSDIYVWDRTQNGLLDLPGLPSVTGSSVEPTLTPDGKLLCFASNRSGLGGYDLFLYDLTAKAFVALPSGPGADANTSSNERHPAISRNGNVIVFQSDRAGGAGKFDLYNCRRVTAAVGQGPQQSSAGDDVDAAVLYP